MNVISSGACGIIGAGTGCPRRIVYSRDINALTR